MPNPYGNPGNKGGGRKSAYQERADARELTHMFFEEIDVKELVEKIMSGKYRVKDALLVKALLGDDRILLGMFNKLFPDHMKVDDAPPTQDQFEALMRRENPYVSMKTLEIYERTR